MGRLASILIGSLLAFQSIHAHSGNHALGDDMDLLPTPWTDKGFLNDSGNFQFAIVGDRTGHHRPGVFADAVEKLNLLQPEFVISVGDLIEGYSEDPRVLIDQWNDFDSILEDLEMRFFYIPGNHDISNEEMAKIWDDRMGTSYYHFIYEDVLFLCLNTEDGKPNHLGKDQLAYIENVLKENKDVRWSIIFLHKPLWIYMDNGVEDTGWDKVERQLSGRPYSVFAGHFHSYTRSTRQDQRYIVLATTGGSSSLRGPEWGELDHVCWITMTDDGPRVCNLQLSGIFDENIVTEDGRTILDSLASKVGVNWDPLFISKESPQSISTSLKLKNDTPYPLELSVDFRKSSQVRITPASFSSSIPPHSVKEQCLAMEFLVDISRSSPPALPFTTSLLFEKKGQPVLELSYGQEIVVMNKYRVPVAASGVRVDGQLDDWAAFEDSDQREILSEADLSHWKGPEDASFLLQAQQDKAFVYLAVQVTDDVSSVDRKSAPWDQDSVCLRVDGRANPERMYSRAGSDDAEKSYIEFLMNPGDDLEDMHPKFIATLPDSCLASCRRSNEGYNMEVAIPLAYFEELQNGTPDGFRANVYINDVDESPQRLKVWWKPSWDLVNSWSGSGSFFFDSR